MKHKVSLKLFIEKVKRRPSLIRTLVGTDDSVLCKAVEENLECVFKMLPGQKTAAVCQKAFHKYIGSDYYNYGRWPLAAHLPQAYLDGMSEADRLRLVGKYWENAKFFAPDRKLWLEAVADVDEFSEIPKEVIDDELIIRFVNEQDFSSQ